MAKKDKEDIIIILKTTVLIFIFGLLFFEAVRIGRLLFLSFKGIFK